jgi:hypothetical protein
MILIAANKVKASRESGSVGGGKHRLRDEPGAYRGKLSLQNQLDGGLAPSAVGPGTACQADLLDRDGPFADRLPDIGVRHTLALTNDHSAREPLYLKLIVC